MENPPLIVKVLLLIAGVIIILALIIWFAGNKFPWIGKLPGDIIIGKENFQFYMPITTMIIGSIILSLFVWLVKKVL